MASFVKRSQESEKNKYYYKDVISIIHKVLLSMSPYINEQRLNDLDEIILQVIHQFNTCEEIKFPKMRFDKNPYLYMDEEEFKRWVDETLKSIPEFRNLNLTYNESQEGIDVNDPNRPMIVISTIYDVDTEDGWKDDFIDLDAAIQNICYEISQIYKWNDDCFCCKYNCTNSEICNTCINNPNFQNNYTTENRPYGSEIERWCSKGCVEGMAVCCYDCNYKDKCQERCCNSFFTNDIVNCDSMIYRKDENIDE